MTPVTIIEKTAPNGAASGQLGQTFRGQLIRPGDETYDQARRVWNGAVDKRPALIARCADGGDVAAAVRLARREGWPVAIRSGGHSGNGLSLVDDGLVIDLSQMKGVAVDTERRVARVEPGLTLGELVQALEPYGLITPTGTCAGNGLGGATLGGGIGWLMGKYGLIVDNLLACEMVTAEGELVRASATERPDLFWGLRGGGGNFGIVTAFELRLYPLDQVLVGTFIYPLARGRQAMKLYRDVSGEAADELAVMAVLATMPEIGPAVALFACYSGDDHEQGEQQMAAFGAAEPLVAVVQPMPYAGLLAMMDPAAPDGRNYYDAAYTVRDFSDEAIDTLVAWVERRVSPLSSVVIQHIHGAASRVAVDATPFALRFDHYAVLHSSAWETGPAGPHQRWADESRAAMARFAGDGVYVNFLGDEGDAAVRASYGANYRRLVALKNKYDPTNFFRRNQNITPTVDGSRGL
ncbi:MAG: FAD-binding oxidoreductase [Caldilineales bacterium]